VNRLRATAFATLVCYGVLGCIFLALCFHTLVFAGDTPTIRCRSIFIFIPRDRG